MVPMAIKINMIMQRIYITFTGFLKFHFLFVKKNIKAETKIIIAAIKQAIPNAISHFLKDSDSSYNFLQLFISKFLHCYLLALTSILFSTKRF